MVKFPELNCFNNSILTAANAFGIDFTNAFCDLLPETEFAYLEYPKGYVSLRLLKNLETLGMKTIKFVRPYGEILGTHFIIGMDSFHTPWNPYFGVFNGPHYFVANRGNGAFTCFDPTYGVINAELSEEIVFTHAFELYAVSEVPKSEIKCDIAEVFAEINHDFAETLLLKFRSYTNSKSELTKLSNYVGCMHDNRYMFGLYLDKMEISPRFDDDHFNRWNTLKRAILKAVLVRKNETIMQEVLALLSELLNEEIIFCALR